MRNPVFLGAIVFGVWLLSLHLQIARMDQWRLPKRFIRQLVLVQGVIVSVPKKQTLGTRFRFELEKFNHHKVRAKILLSWYQQVPELQVGEQWQLQVRLKPPVGLHNPGGFDYAHWLFLHGIRATGYVVQHGLKLKTNHLMRPASGFLLTRLRNKIETAISQSVHNHSLAAIITALSVGLRDDLTQNDWHVFQKTGTSHLIAISGLHIGLVAASFFALMSFAWRRLPRLLLFKPAVIAASIFAIFGAFIYTVMSGFALPAQRALIMIICLMGAQLCYRSAPITRRLLIAFVVIILCQPLALYSASFWLSFFAVSILAYVFGGCLQCETSWKTWGRVQAVMVLGLLPLTLWIFHQVSVVSMITNMFAIPWIGFVIVPLALVGSLIFLCGGVVFGKWIFWLAGKCLWPLWIVLNWFAHWPIASWHHAIPNAWIFSASLIAVALLLMPRGIPGRWVGCIGFLPLFFYHPQRPQLGAYWVRVLDVGQGLAVVIQTAKHVLIYDTGAHFPGGFDAGASVVVPYLAYENIKHIDRMMISHGDNDHSGGAKAIMAAMPVQSILTSAPKLVHQLHGKFCDAGQSWRWDGVFFNVLSPKRDSIYQDNNSSCVLKISATGGQTLLTGDIEKLEEQQLVRQYGRQLYSTLLIVPHHGSPTSSSVQLIQAVSPHYAVISAGQYNRYHFPAKSVVVRYLKHHIQVMTTAQAGAISIKFQ